MIRQFETGASRDTEDGKLDFEGFLSPLVLKKYAEYMHENRKMKDGSLRNSDNWQKGIPRDVYMKSLWRHFHDLWMIHRGHEGREDVDHAICGIMFNIMGYYHEYLNDNTSEIKSPLLQGTLNGTCYAQEEQVVQGN